MHLYQKLVDTRRASVQYELSPYRKWFNLARLSGVNKLIPECLPPYRASEPQSLNLNNLKTWTHLSQVFNYGGDERVKLISISSLRNFDFSCDYRILRKCWKSWLIIISGMVLICSTIVSPWQPRCWIGSRSLQRQVIPLQKPSMAFISSSSASSDADCVEAMWSRA